MLPVINIFSLSISTYWMMFFVGVASIVALCCSRAKRYRLSRPKAVLYAILLTLSGLLGTKLLYVLEHWQQTVEEGLTLGGQSFFGALFLVPFLVIAFGGLLGFNPSSSTDFAAPPVIAILLCMRIGCFLEGCCGGIQLGAFRAPTQLIEAVFDAMILTYLLSHETANADKGTLYPRLMGLYGVVRFFVEFLRSTPKDWFFLSHGQWFSIAAIVVAIVWLWMNKKRYKTNEKQETHG